MATQNSRMRQRRGTAAEWASANPVLNEGEIGFVEDSNTFKVGDGSTAWINLKYPEIKTGTFSSTPPDFGATWVGIEREARCFPAGEMCSPTAVMNFGDGFPRLNMPAGDTTDAYMIFEVEEWWLRSTIGVYFEWVNDHSATGVVRWDCTVRQVKIGTQGPLTSTLLASRTVDVPDVPANLSTTTIAASVANGNPVDLADPGEFASFYCLKVSRLGGHANDTLAGPVGLVAASMTRGQ